MKYAVKKEPQPQTCRKSRFNNLKIVGRYFGVFRVPLNKDDEEDTCCHQASGSCSTFQSLGI